MSTVSTSDAAQDYLDSGGQTAHPLSTAGGESAAFKPSNDPAQDFLDSGGKTAHPIPARTKEERRSLLREWAMAPVGAAEEFAKLGTGAVAAIPAGLAYGGAAVGKAFGADVNPADVQRRTQDYLTYKPRSDSAKAAESDIAATYGPAVRAVTGAADKAATKVGQVSPTAETFLREAPGAFQAASAVFPVASAGVDAAKTATNAIKATKASREAATSGKDITKVPGLGSLPSSPRPSESLDLTLGPSAPRTTPSSASSAPAPQPELTASGLPRGQMWEPHEIPSRPGTPIDSEPQEGGLPTDAQASRAAILKRVGIQDDKARVSAIRGDAMAAATDAQMTKFDEPAGRQAKAVFDGERAALEKHGQKIINDAGGTLGTDEEALHARGQTIAQPFDDLREWFKTEQQKNYAEADARAGGSPVTKLEGVDALLQDPTFRNTLLAKDQGGLLKSVESQLEEFRKQSPNGFTAQGAEDVRKWLNQVWTHDNRYAVGKLKDAIDDDVMKGAGEDLYAKARAITQAKAATLDDPKAISHLFDTDPQTPLNRVTPHSKIPDAIMRLDPGQYRNLLDTLQRMPQEIQPQAQAAIGEIKGHLVNRMLEAGTGKTPDSIWNATAVNSMFDRNSAKLAMSFGNDARAVQNLRDLRQAGNILRANASYPGAAAQAANAMKRGLMTKAIQHAAVSAGAGVGGVVTGGPLGAAIGAGIGESLGSKVANSVGEKAAARRFQKERLTKLSDLLKK